MAGCRALKKTEIVKVLKELKNPRDRLLVHLSHRAGFRISEMLSLNVQDVRQFGSIVDRVRVRAMYMKGKDSTREVILHQDVKNAIGELLATYPIDYTGPLFRSREGDNKAISRKQAHYILKGAINQLELKGKLAFHSLRKTYCQTVYTALDHDIYKTAKAMGHRSIASTASYLSYDQDEIDSVIVNAK